MKIYQQITGSAPFYKCCIFSQLLVQIQAARILTVRLSTIRWLWPDGPNAKILRWWDFTQADGPMDHPQVWPTTMAKKWTERDVNAPADSWFPPFQHGAEPRDLNPRGGTRNQEKPKPTDGGFGVKMVAASAPSSSARHVWLLLLRMPGPECQRLWWREEFYSVSLILKNLLKLFVKVINGSPSDLPHFENGDRVHPEAMPEEIKSHLSMSSEK